MPMRACSPAFFSLRRTLLGTAATLAMFAALPAQAGFFDSLTGSDDAEQSGNLGPKRVPEHNAGDRTPASALQFDGTQPPHAAGAFDAASPQVQGMIDQPMPAPAAPQAQAPATPLFSEPATPPRLPESQPGLGDRALGWMGLGSKDAEAPVAANAPVTDQTSSAAPNMVPIDSPAPSIAAATPPATPVSDGVEYYDANGYPILAETPAAPARPSIAAKAEQAEGMVAQNRAAEATRSAFIDRGESAFAPSPAEQAYQPAPLNQPIAPLADAGNAGPMDELAFGGATAPAPMPAASPPAETRLPVNAPDSAQSAAPAPLHPTRLTDTAPLDMPPMGNDGSSGSIDLMAGVAPDQPGLTDRIAESQGYAQQAPLAPEPAPMLEAPVQAAPVLKQAYRSAPMEPVPTFQPAPPPPAPVAMQAAPAPMAPELPAAPMPGAWASAAPQESPAQPSPARERMPVRMPVQQAQTAPAPAPEPINRALPQRAPLNLAARGDEVVPTQQAAPMSGTVIPLPAPIAEVAASSAATPQDVHVEAPGTAGANRVAPLRYLPESRYAERRLGTHTAVQ